MSWPTLQEYNEAIQNPQTAFTDPELKAGKPELDSLGLPRVRTGQFACVYRMQCARGDWAVRCFSQEIKDQQERYKAIDDYISPLNISYIVGFDYLSKEILVRGQRYPILRMEWIQGELISEYIKRNLRNPSALRQLAVGWVEMLKELQANSIAHGDLQHGNVLVVNNELKLVDYDGMFVPALSGRGSHEIGHRNYQHPDRKESDFGPYLDNFSAWVIYVSLVALSVDPTLWDQVKPDENDCLLFRNADFEQPLLSTTLGLLTGHRDPNIRTLATVFRSMPFFPPQQVPSLDGEVPPMVQPNANTGSTNLAWWSDYGASSPGPQVAPEVLSQNQVVGTSASWILDFLSPSCRAHQHVFARSVALPRLTTGLSALILGLTFGLGIALPDILPGVFTGDWSYLLSLSFILALLFAVFVDVNTVVLVWRYRNEPTVKEKGAVRTRERNVRKSMADLEITLIGCEKKRAAFKGEENKRRKEFDNAIERLREREQKELNVLQGAHGKNVLLIDGRRRILDQQEREELLNLIPAIEYRVNCLKRDIAALEPEEAYETQKEVKALQNEYIERYLKKYPISSTTVAKLGISSPSNLSSALLAHGILTALDVSSARVYGVQGFGPVRTRALVEWRNSLENDAIKTIPHDQIMKVKNSVRLKYETQRTSLERQKDAEQATLAMEERAIRERYKTARQTLDIEKSTAQKQVDQGIQAISNRYAQQFLAPNQALIQLSAEFGAKHQQVDEEIKRIQQEMAQVAWQIAKIHHEQMAFKNISFYWYLKVVFFGHRAK